jgi:hypothetical protein
MIIIDQQSAASRRWRAPFRIRGSSPNGGCFLPARWLKNGDKICFDRCWR